MICCTFIKNEIVKENYKFQKNHRKRMAKLF